MNPRLLFFLIGFSVSLIGFFVGFLAGDRTADLRDQEDEPSQGELAELAQMLRSYADAARMHRYSPLHAPWISEPVADSFRHVADLLESGR